MAKLLRSVRSKILKRSEKIYKRLREEPHRAITSRYGLFTFSRRLKFDTTRMLRRRDKQDFNKFGRLRFDAA